MTRLTMTVVLVEEFMHPCDRALDEANAKGWTVVDMKRDWKRIFPFE